MKLSMETMYFPEAKFHHKKEMMADWTQTSEKASAFSWVALVFSVAAAILFSSLKDEYFFVYLGSAAIFLIGALFCKKWKYPAYISAFVGELLCCTRFYLEMPENTIIFVVAVVVAVVGVLPSYFAFRCVFNYGSVFKELEKSVGFPNFIANTADLLGDKLYLRDEEETVFENITEASYNPFNSDEDIKNEEVRRYQEARVESRAEPIEMNIGVDGRLVSAEEEKAKRKEKEKEAKKGGFFIGDYELVFAHGDLYDDDYDQKRVFMGKWRENVESTTNNFPLFAFIMAFAVMASGFGSIVGIINFAIILLFVLATNHMKMGRWYAPVTMIIGVLYSFTLANSEIAIFMIIGAYLAGFRMFLGMICYVLNYKNYKILSKQAGFPTFIRTTADLYGDRLYIVEKREPAVRGNLQQKRVKVMDIGYDNKPKKDEGAWNAFNYMDEKKEEEDKNES